MLDPHQIKIEHTYLRVAGFWKTINFRVGNVCKTWAGRDCMGEIVEDTAEQQTQQE